MLSVESWGYLAGVPSPGTRLKSVLPTWKPWGLHYRSKDKQKLSIASDPFLLPCSYPDPHPKHKRARPQWSQGWVSFLIPLCPGFLVEGFYAQSLHFGGLHEKKFKGRKGFHQLILPPFNYKLLIGAIVSGRQENVWRVTERICRWTWLLVKSNVPVVTMAQKTPAIFSLCVSVHIDRWIDRYIDWLMDFRILSPRESRLVVLPGRRGEALGGWADREFVTPGCAVVLKGIQ